MDWFEIILEAHLLTLAITGVIILIADHDAFQYFRGQKKLLDPVRIKRLHCGVMIGLSLMILTGVFLFKELWGELLTLPAFYIKMCMVSALVVNSFIIGKLMHVATTRAFTELQKSEKVRLLLSGATSALCWIGSAVIGFLFL